MKTSVRNDKSVRYTLFLTFFFLSAERKKITKKKDCRLLFGGFSVAFLR